MATGGKRDTQALSWRGEAFKNLTVKELPPQNFEPVRACKSDMENSGLDPNIFKNAIVNSLVKLQFALLAFAACGKWVDQNEIYNIGRDFVKLLAELENTFLKLRLSTRKVLERSRSAYHYADDGVYDLAQKNLDVVAKEVKKMHGELPDSLLTRMDDILTKTQTLQNQYIEERQKMQKGFEPQTEEKKRALEKKRQKKDKEFEEEKKKMDAEIETLCNKWFNKDFHTQSADHVKKERKQAEEEQRNINDQFQKAIESLNLEPDEMVRRDPTGRALHGAIDAFKALSSYLGSFQGLLNSIQSYYESAGGNPIIGWGYDGDLQELLRQESSKIDIITGYCRWMALEELFQVCFSRVHSYQSQFSNELMANPTQAEAHQKLKDPAWNEEKTRLLRSLEKSDRFAEPAPDDDTRSEDTPSIGETVATDEQTDDDKPILREVATIDYPNPRQVADEHDVDENITLPSLGSQNTGLNSGHDLRQRIQPDHPDEGDPGDNPPPPGPRQPDVLDFPMPPSPVFLSVFVLLLLAAVFLQWVLSRLGLL